MNFLQKKTSSSKNKAFTLIELTVTVAVLAILLLSIKSINFSRLNWIQKLEIFTNKIIANYENIRNDSLIWKWLWSDFDIPKEWKIEYSLNNNWEIITNYKDDSDVWNNYWNIKFEKDFKMTKINCKKLDWTSQTPSPSQASIVFNWSNLSLSGSCDDDTRILELIIENSTNNSTLNINTINWLIEVIK